MSFIYERSESGRGEHWRHRAPLYLASVAGGNLGAASALIAFVFGWRTMMVNE